MTERKRHDGRRPKDWAKIDVDQALGVPTLTLMKDAIPPAVGYESFKFSMPVSDIVELRDAFTAFLRAAGVER